VKTLQEQKTFAICLSQQETASHFPGSTMHCQLPARAPRVKGRSHTTGARERLPVRSCTCCQTLVAVHLARNIPGLVARSRGSGSAVYRTPKSSAVAARCPAPGLLPPHGCWYEHVRQRDFAFMEVANRGCESRLSLASASICGSMLTGSSLGGRGTEMTTPPMNRPQIRKQRLDDGQIGGTSHAQW
jgi:hypothetical protein